MSANDTAIFTIDSKRANKEDFYSAADAPRKEPHDYHYSSASFYQKGIEEDPI